MTGNPWSQSGSKTVSARKMREYADKKGKWVPVTPGHQPHVDAEGSPVEYEERDMGPRDAVELGRQAHRGRLAKSGLPSLTPALVSKFPKRWQS